VDDMVEFLQTPTARLTIQLTLLLIISVVAWYVVRRFRGRIKNDETTSDHLTNFRKMQQRGGLNDKEFRTIKTSLGPWLQDEINDNGEPR
jgi:membrane protein implicated in regulation of membrane protease activity